MDGNEKNTLGPKSGNRMNKGGPKLKNYEKEKYRNLTETPEASFTNRKQEIILETQWKKWMPWSKKILNLKMS